jgi:hypothetical protein
MPLLAKLFRQKENFDKEIIQQARVLTILSEQPLLELDHLIGQSHYA